MEPTRGTSSAKLILILGGARSGKSAFAERLAHDLGDRVLYVATAQALDGEMEARIRAHRARRPAQWRTLESPRDVGAALRAAALPGEVVLLDCLTLLVSNVILAAGDDAAPAVAQPAVDAEIGALLAAVRVHDAPVIVVSNEVGLGGVPLYPLGRIFQDVQGWANQRLAQEAAQVFLMVAGIPVDIKRLGGA